MNTLNAALKLLEYRLETIFEDRIASLFPGGASIRGLAKHLEESLLVGIRQSIDGKFIAPSLFILKFHPAQANILQSDNTWSTELAKSLQEVGLEAGLQFDSPPEVHVLADESVRPGEVVTIAKHNLHELPDTTTINIEKKDEIETLPKNAYLIVNGTTHFPLTQIVINIGRRSDNHLVLDDSRVSRLHAQLRVNSDSYVIFDLDSTGGTWVNGERVLQARLLPGDVISLAGFPIIYGQDQSDHSDTQDYKPFRTE